MRWEGLFADLEGQLAAEERRELDSEVAERTRRERALVDLTGRLAATVGSPVSLLVEGGRVVSGVLADVGDGWLLVADPPRELLVPRGALVTVEGLPPHADPARTARRFGLGHALRALARDRATVTLEVSSGRRSSAPSTSSVPTTSCSPSTPRASRAGARTSAGCSPSRSRPCAPWGPAAERWPATDRAAPPRGRRQPSVGSGASVSPSVRVVTSSRVSAYIRWM
ncbi:hypothetical protein [Phycicoccus sp. HDW14]|uniref:hypothetical protein n=1 Tax=Phycicoccus sp. HDW14 TaxID=2714941 RepID=UPI00197B0AB1|nr:hypothetical protein [Phycicoccus sp. HDW14]